MRRTFCLSIILALIAGSLTFAATSERPMLIRVDLHNKGAADILKSGNLGMFIYDVTC